MSGAGYRPDHWDAVRTGEREEEPPAIEVLGIQCIDGGTCHHQCATECFRKSCCVPLSCSGLNDDWTPKRELPVMVPPNPHEWDAWRPARDLA
jgi:hypothetical protein